MGAMTKKSESMSNHAFKGGVSQFKLTTNTITKLNTFKLTPTAKLVLLYLTTCYNPKHKEVFPKQKTIADKLGVSEVSVTRAICELHREGLVLSERKISNKYVFTSKIVSEPSINLIDDKQQNDRGENINLTFSYIHEQKKETKKEQRGKIDFLEENIPQKDSNSIEFEESKILKEYAIKHGAKNVEAYINVLRKNGSADKIIKEYKAKEYAKKRALRSIEETQSQLRIYESMKYDCVLPSESSTWLELGKKINAHRVVASASV